LIKVLHIFGKMNRGGAEMRTLEVMPLMAEKGVRFDFCTLSAERGQLDEKIRQLRGEVFPCPLRPKRWSFPARFVEFLKNSDYDIVHSHVHYASGYIVRLAYKARIKGRIVHFRNTTDGVPNTLTRRIYRRIMRRLIDKYATSILAVCRGAMEFGWGSGWQRDNRAQVIYNGLDTSVFEQVVSDRIGLIEELGLNPESKIVINVAHIHHQKAHDVLLDAAVEVISQDKKTHFVLVGDGVLRSEMENKAAQLSIERNVHFLGVRNDVPRLLKSSDCFVLPSRWEGLPGVVLEAMAAGLPVVATDLPGVREIAEHTNQITIVPIEDEVALSEAIIKVCFDESTRTGAGQPFPSEFDLQRCAEKLYEVYHQQVEG